VALTTFCSMRHRHSIRYKTRSTSTKYSRKPLDESGRGKLSPDRLRVSVARFRIVARLPATDEHPSGLAAPCCSYRSLRSSLARLRAGLPDKVVASKLPFRKAMAYRVVGALRFLGLVTPTGQPTMHLLNLVKLESEEEERRVLRERFLASFRWLWPLPEGADGTHVLDLLDLHGGVSQKMTPLALAFIRGAAKDLELELPADLPNQGHPRLSALTADQRLDARSPSRENRRQALFDRLVAMLDQDIEAGRRDPQALEMLGRIIEMDAEELTAPRPRK
jgi:hypothetical protein